jgi:glycosyltransferase involved in cell wall biosynthesis
MAKTYEGAHAGALPAGKGGKVLKSCPGILKSFDLNISIVMPCYRGEQYIENSIRLVGDEVGKFENQFELIVVVDGLLDNTYEKASNMQEVYKYIKVVGYEKNRGKGYAVRYGTEFCRGKYIIFLDSDMDYHPRSIKTLLEYAVHKKANIVVGNRRDKGSIFVYPMIRKLRVSVLITM